MPLQGKSGAHEERQGACLSSCAPGEIHHNYPVLEHNTKSVTLSPFSTYPNEKWRQRLAPLFYCTPGNFYAAKINYFCKFCKLLMLSQKNFPHKNQCWHLNWT